AAEEALLAGFFGEDVTFLLADPPGGAGGVGDAAVALLAFDPRRAHALGQTLVLQAVAGGAVVAAHTFEAVAIRVADPALAVFVAEAEDAAVHAVAEARFTVFGL